MTAAQSSGVLGLSAANVAFKNKYGCHSLHSQENTSKFGPKFIFLLRNVYQFVMVS